VRFQKDWEEFQGGENVNEPKPFVFERKWASTVISGSFWTFSKVFPMFLK
jgi:hypothetical protein